MTKADISIVIVNWKVRALVEKLLDTILEHKGDLNLQILLVDNDSRDGTSEMVIMKYAETVTMIALSRNKGFAVATNLAIKQASADYILLLNPDAELKPDFLKNILAYAKSNPRAGIIGPHLIFPDGRSQDSVRRLPSLKSQIFVLLKLINVPQANLILSQYLYKDFDYSKEQSVEQVMGAAMMIRRELIDKIGTLDEGFFVWFEEVDFCKRARQAGWDVMYYPGAELIHHQGVSFSKRAVLRKQLIFNHSLQYYFWKHKPLYQWLIIVLMLPINYLLTITYVAFIQKK